jgi:drug/metabolite transporter (DMT)-like permease
MFMKSKTIFTLILLVACPAVTFFISKNSNDLIVAPFIATISALFVLALTMLSPSRRNREEFHSQFNFWFLAATIGLALTRTFS